MNIRRTALNSHYSASSSSIFTFLLNQKRCCQMLDTGVTYISILTSLFQIFRFFFCPRGTPSSFAADETKRTKKYLAVIISLQQRAWERTLLTVRLSYFVGRRMYAYFSFASVYCFCLSAPILNLFLYFVLVSIIDSIMLFLLTFQRLFRFIQLFVLL